MNKDLVKLSCGNIGALRVLHDLANAPWPSGGEATIEAIKELGWSGADIWVGFKDFADGDLEYFSVSVKKKDPELLACVQAAR